MNSDDPFDQALENNYNVSLNKPNAAEVVAAWETQCKSIRETADATFDCSYGSGVRNKIDVFRCADIQAPVLIYIHGGYWQRGARESYSFLAEPFLASGVNVAVIGYELCPGCTISSITEQVQNALIWLWRNGASVGISPDRLNICGHSAGGQLAAMMVATHWPDLAEGLPQNLVKTATAISGLYQLAPLRHTTIGAPLHLNDAEVAANSPYLLHPVNDIPLLVGLGANETPQFHWQAGQLMGKWAPILSEMTYHSEPDVDHYDVLTRLANSDSALFRKIRTMLC